MQSRAGQGPLCGIGWYRIALERICVDLCSYAMVGRCDAMRSPEAGRQTYLGKDDQKTRLTTGTVTDDDELSAKFRHGWNVCEVCEERESPERRLRMRDSRGVRCERVEPRSKAGRGRRIWHLEEIAGRGSNAAMQGRGEKANGAAQRWGCRDPQLLASGSDGTRWMRRCAEIGPWDEGRRMRAKQRL